MAFEQMMFPQVGCYLQNKDEDHAQLFIPTGCPLASCVTAEVADLPKLQTLKITVRESRNLKFENLQPDNPKAKIPTVPKARRKTPGLKIAQPVMQKGQSSKLAERCSKMGRTSAYEFSSPAWLRDSIPALGSGSRCVWYLRLV